MIVWILAVYVAIAAVYSIAMPGLIRQWADELDRNGVTSRNEAMRLANLSPPIYIVLGLIWPVVVFVGVRGRLRAS